MSVHHTPFHIVAKPIGALCNMNCSYCFYAEKKSFYPAITPMTDKVLEHFIRSYLSAHPGPEVNFLWQGGEPLLLGISFYQKALLFQQRFSGRKRITNAIQTNGTLLTEAWCQFLKRNHFLVGISLDGPADIHNAYRCMRSGKPSHQAVLNGLQLLQKYQVDYNVTCCVSDVSTRDPKKIYHYLKSLGVAYLQFAPLVEREPDIAEQEEGLLHACPDNRAGHLNLMPGTVDSLAYGQFLSAVFDEWIRQDIGRIYIMNFEWALSAWLGLPATYCIFAPTCGNALAVEHNGDLYSCDHYVYAAYKIGNLMHDDLNYLLDSPIQQKFQQKKSTLPDTCVSCTYCFACHGECPKNRFMPGDRNYLCQGYFYYFSHIRPYMERMADLIRKGMAPWLIRNEFPDLM